MSDCCIPSLVVGGVFVRQHSIVKLKDFGNKQFCIWHLFNYYVQFSYEDIVKF